MLRRRVFRVLLFALFSLPAFASWVEVNSVAATKQWWSITSSDDGDKLAAVVVGGNVWTSTDCGVTWIEVTGGDTNIGGTKAWRGIASSDDGTKLAAVVYGLQLSSHNCSQRFLSTNARCSSRN